MNRPIELYSQNTYFTFHTYNEIKEPAYYEFLGLKSKNHCLELFILEVSLLQKIMDLLIDTITPHSF